MAEAMGYLERSDPMFQQIMLAGQQPYDPPTPAQSIGGIHPLTQQEITAEVEAEIIDSIGAYGSPVHEQRRINLRRYQGKPFGNEVEGQSQAQVSTVADTIEWIQPAVMKAIFGSTSNIWDFEPTRPGEEAGANDAGDFINHIFLHECDGFKKMMDFTKTANLEKRGYLAVYFEEVFEPKRETYRGMGEVQLGIIASDPNVELVEFGPHDGEIVIDPMTGQPLETFDVTVKRVTKIGRIRIDSIAPEHMLLPRRETELNDDTRFSGYRKKMTVGELIALGYDPEVVALLPNDNKAEFSEGRIERLYDENSFPVNLQERGDGASRQLWVNFIWMRLDEDGDGYAELRHIVCVGDSSINIISDREVSHNALVSLSPIPMPHKFHGQCPADQAVDLQLIESTILRQMLDNLYRLNHGRYEVVNDMVNIDDLVDNRPGGAVRVDAIGMIKGLDTPPLPNYSFEMLNYMNSMGEKRTGVSSWQQGPDAADMKYQTAGAVSNVSTASEARVNLINTVFAQTGIKDLGKKLLQIICENYVQPQMFRLRGKWIQCDPRSWNAGMDVTVNTGLGVGDSEAKLGKLGMLTELQERLLKGGGHMMVTPRNIYNTLREIVKISDLGPEGFFFTDPGDQPWPEPQPKLVDQVKLMESQRRALEDQNVDNQATMSLAVEASQGEQLAQFRYVELDAKARLKAAELANQREVVRIQMQGQIEAAMANRQYRQAA